MDDQRANREGGGGLRRTARNVFFAQLIIAGMMFFWGLFIVSTRPYFLLDVVLSPEELQNDKKHDETLALLQKANEHEPAAWVVTAALVAVSSAIGLRATRRVETN
jgi:hypothetical protein